MTGWNIGLWLVLGLAVLGIVCAFLLPRLAPGFETRRCHGQEWKRRFPQASKHDIRAFLNLLSDYIDLEKLTLGELFQHMKGNANNTPEPIVAKRAEGSA